MNKSQSKHKKISGYPISYAQKRMWFLGKLESKKLVNNIGFLCKLEGELDFSVFQKAIQTLTKRHEAFRTNFIQTKIGDIVQIVSTRRKNNFQIFDIFRRIKKKF